MEYFTPSIEDIRVGYECEMRQRNIWEFYRIQWNDCLSDFVDMDGIRVPYLTKEQIENEGWKFIHSSSWETGDLIGFEKDDWIISYNLKTKVMTISFKYASAWNIEIYGPLIYSYRGPCKDINTFRQICKLYNI